MKQLTFIVLGLAFLFSGPAVAQHKFVALPKIQYIAALTDPKANAGNNAETWGIWRRDPGPIGVRLTQFDVLKATGGIGPAGWQFDPDDWWLDENGLIMKKPDFPVSPGTYIVTGGRETFSKLTIDAPDEEGRQAWRLDEGVEAFDVTHLPCRSARYRPLDGAAPGSCTPASAPLPAWPVAPGSVMPDVPGCARLDYAVMFVVAIALGDVEDTAAAE